MDEVYGQSGQPPRPGEDKAEPVEGEVVEVRRREPGEEADGFGLPGVPQIPRWRYRPSSVLGAVTLVLLCVLVFLPGFFALPPVDRDEARFAQASRQMYESAALPEGVRDVRPLRAAEEGRPFWSGGYHSGGWVVPMLQDRARLNKPPLIYWLQASAAAVFSRGNPYRDAVWMYRVPSLLAGVGTVLLVYWLGLRMFDRRTGWLAAGLLAVSPVIAWESHQARADMVLLFLTTAFMAALWRCFQRGDARERGSWRPALVLWIVMGLGVLTKGPITPLVVILAAAVLSVLAGEYRWLIRTKPLVGIVVVVAIVAPWVWAVGERVGWDHYLATITRETVGRSVSSREGHWGPPGYHTLLLPVLFWPGSLLTAAGIGLAWRASRGRGAEIRAAAGGGVLARLKWDLREGSAAPYAFCLAWAVPSWIVFELVVTKLPHYTMPLYPAVALLSARAVLAAQAGALGLSGRGAKVGVWIWVAIWVALVVLAAAGVAYRAAVVPNTFGGVVGKLFTLFLLLLAAMHTRTALRWWREGRYLRVQLAGVFSAVVLVMLCIGFIAPVINKLPREIQEAIFEIDPEQRRPIAGASYQEDSLIFTTRGRAERVNILDLGAWWEAHPEGLVISRPEQREEVGLGERARVVREVRGFNFGAARMEQLAIMERGP